MDRNLPILLAEDSEDYALILQSAMTVIGWTNPIRIVHNGKEAIEYLSGEGKYRDRQAWPFPSVMFVDINMPQVDGFAVLRWMRKHPERAVLPVIMLSSSDDEKDVRLAYELGANGYFVKPAFVSDLKAMLDATYEFWARCSKPELACRNWGARGGENKKAGSLATGIAFAQTGNGYAGARNASNTSGGGRSRRKREVQ